MRGLVGEWEWEWELGGWGLEKPAPAPEPGAESESARKAVGGGRSWNQCQQASELYLPGP